MAELRWKLPEGELRVHGWQRSVMEAALEEGLELVRSGQKVGEFRSFIGHEVYLKAAPLGSSARWRHGLAYTLKRRPWPRVNEYQNLSWLLERHFQTVLPLAAGVWLQGGWPRYQFLATARCSECHPFEECFPGAPPHERQTLLEELARETARMHSLRFVHRDLYPRNLLVLPAAAPRRILFLDAWAGGLAPQARPVTYDVACFFLEGTELLEEGEQLAWLERYAGERRLQGRPLEPNWTEGVRRQRERLWRQLELEPARRRGRELPRREWSVLDAWDRHSRKRL